MNSGLELHSDLQKENYNDRATRPLSDVCAHSARKTPWCFCFRLGSASDLQQAVPLRAAQEGVVSGS